MAGEDERKPEGESQPATEREDIGEKVKGTGQAAQTAGRVGQGAAKAAEVGAKDAELGAKGVEAGGKALKETAPVTKETGEAVGKAGGAAAGAAVGGAAGAVGGAVTGAIKGAAAGGVGAIPGAVAGAAEGAATGAEKGAEIGEKVGGAVGQIPGEVQEKVGAAAEAAGKAGKEAAQTAKEAAKKAEEVGKKVEEVGKKVKGQIPGLKEAQKIEEKKKKIEEKVERAREEGLSEEEIEAREAAKKGKKRLKWGCLGCLITGALGTTGCGGIILFLLVIIVPVLLITGGGGGGIGRGVAGNTYLNQTDPPWGSQVYCGSYGTIGQTGCTVTTGAMALRSIGIDTDPEQLAQKLCNAKGSWGFGMGGQQAAASFYGVKLVSVNSESELIQAVSAGHAVGIYANPAGDISAHSNLQGQPHSVLVIGVSGNQMTVMDPSDPNGRGKSKQENVTRTCSLSSWTGAGEKWGYYYTK